MKKLVLILGLASLIAVPQLYLLAEDMSGQSPSMNSDASGTPAAPSQATPKKKKHHKKKHKKKAAAKPASATSSPDSMSAPTETAK